MRYGTVLLILLVGACNNDDSMTRNFGVSRNSTPDTAAAPLMPLSVPPGMASRPQRPSPLVTANQTGPNGAPADQAPLSQGQEALLDAAGPSADPGVRRSIDQNSGMVYPGADFVNEVMNWSPPPGYRPLTKQSSGGWLSGLF
jgi:hypothetical protein